MDIGAVTGVITEPVHDVILLQFLVLSSGRYLWTEQAAEFSFAAVGGLCCLLL
jgi:hypothetical protein